MSSRHLLCGVLFGFGPRRRAVDVVRANDRAPSNPIFPNGLDVFGRDARCRACHALVNALNENLIPSIAAERAKPASRATYGALDALIEAALAPACRLSATWRDATTRKACERLMETREDDVAAAYHRWIKRGGGSARDGGGTRGDGSRVTVAEARSGAYDPVGWNWNYEVCGRATGACREQLAMPELAEFDDDGAGDGEARKYRSEQRPADGETVDGMLKVTAGTFHEAVVRRDADVVAYVGFPKLDKWGHFYAAAALGSVREMFASNETAREGFEIAFVDGTHNDVPPPYGSDAQAPTVAKFAAGNKNWPRYMTDMNDGKLTAFEVLQFIMRTSAKPSTVQHAHWLTQSLSQNALHRRIWDDDEL